MADLFPTFGRVIGAFFGLAVFAWLFIFTIDAPEKIEANYQIKLENERKKMLHCINCDYRWKMRFPHNPNNPPSKCPNCDRKLR
jgi:rubrerythrin